MLKKNLKLILLVCLLLAVSIFLVLKQRSSTLDQELTDFAVKDTAAIDKLFLVDRAGRNILLEKKDAEKWILNQRFGVRMDRMHYFLKVLNRLKVTAPVPKNMYNNIIKQLSTSGVKVEVYSKGEKIKVFYVGNATQGGDGSFMMLENSAAPFAVSMPGFEGYLTPNFDCTESQWRSNEVFNSNYKEIVSVKVQNFERPTESFEFTKNGSNLSTVQLSLNGKLVTNFDTVRANHYLMQFTKLNYEAVADLVRETRKDSALHMPLFQVELVLNDGRKQKVLFMKKPTDDGMIDDFGKTTYIDTDRMFAILNDNKNEFLVAQYFVFGKILIPGTSFLK